MTREDIESVIRLIPTVGYSGARAESYYGEGRETREQFLDRQQRLQDELFDCGPMLSLVCVWCTAVARRRTVDRGTNSYGYKHDVERNFGQYVSNGQFVTAAVFCRIPYAVEPDGLNVAFAISRRNPKSPGGCIELTGRLPGQPEDWWAAIQAGGGEPLWRAVVSSPGDTLPRLVLADWLEERGQEPWGQWLRHIPIAANP